MKPLILKIIKISIPLLVGFYLLWYFFQQMSENQLDVFYTSIYHANYGWIFLSIFFSFLTFIIRAERWKLSLEPLGYKTSLANRYHSLLIGYLINFTIPRAGEVSRAIALQRSEQVPFAPSFGTILSERIVDLICLASIVIITYTLNTSDFQLLFQKTQSAFSLHKEKSYLPIFLSFVSVCLGIIYVSFSSVRKKINHFCNGLSKGVLSLFGMRRFGLYIVYSLLIWVIYVGHFYLCFFSLFTTSTISFHHVLLAFIAGSIGIIFTNGGIGAFPLLIGLTIAFTNPHIQDAHAVGNALGMIIWISETLLILVLGVISLLLLPKSNKNGTISETIQ